MKIRVGFVSNSSSSSYILVLKNLEISDIKTYIQKKKTLKNLYIEGLHLSDGKDLFNITDCIPIQMYIMLTEQYILPDYFNVYEILKWFDDDDDQAKEACKFIKTLDDSYFIKTIEKDQHSTDSYDNFKHRYIDEENMSKFELIEKICHV